jgi:hypothetical protein
MRDINNEVCGRSEDLIAFLYHELSEQDERRFQRHLHECAACAREIGSFGEIRESIITWRDASLGTAWTPTSVNEGQQVLAQSRTHPSAWVAIREFFKLSPLWLKGAATFASLLFCVCAVLAVIYLKDQTSHVENLRTDKIYSQKELDQQVAKATQLREEQLRSELLKQPGSEVVSTSTVGAGKAVNRTGQLREASYAGNTQNLRKPLTRRERRELASDLGLLTSRDDDELDLVTDKITQTP